MQSAPTDRFQPNRVGLLPTWGLSVRLTGGYLSASDALWCGLVTEVVAHDDLLAAAHLVGASIVGNNQKAVRALLDSQPPHRRSDHRCRTVAQS